MSNDQATLAEAWRMRNTAATMLSMTEGSLRRALGAASAEDIVALLESFAPGRSVGPEWVRGFEPLMERIWLWADDATIAAVAAVFAARGPMWAGVAHALSPAHGAVVRADVRHPSGAKLPAFTLG